MQRGALLIGAVGLGLCVIGALFSAGQFFQSYLFAYVFWLGIAVGCLGIVMLHNLSGGGWGEEIRGLLESGMNTLPLMALLFLPLLLGLHHLYEWARPEDVARDLFLQHKAAYLNLPFFMIRALIYFALWIGAAVLLTRWSAQARRADLRAHERMRGVSGPGLVIYVLTITFASIDWIMSLEAHWYSTIFGVHFLGGHGLSALAFAVLFSAIFWRDAPAGETAASRRLDLGNMLLGFVMLWGYFTLSQWLIIWSANLPEEAVWYTHRNHGGWQWLVWMLVVFHFFVPFFLLLARRNKHRAKILATIAATILLMRLIDIFWYTVPAFHPGEFHLHWMDIAAAVGLGGIWLGFFLWQLQRAPFEPVRISGIREDAAHG
jgi:hypothetical protein